MIEGCVVQWKKSDTSCASTTSSSVDFAEHNVWNPMMELLFHVQIGGIFELFVEESRFLVILLLMYYVTKNVLTIKFTTFLGTIAWSEELFS